jgi:predicted GNAT family N-acyltransferase
VIARLARPEDMPAVFALRQRVFVVEQGVPAELELDDMDGVSDHAVALLGADPEGEVVGTGRLLPSGVIGRMAVAREHRGQGVGAAVLACLEQRARERGLAVVELHAQVHAARFYDKAGWSPYGEVFLEAGIEHVAMRKELR